jgi:hypothetical protein
MYLQRHGALGDVMESEIEKKGPDVVVPMVWVDRVHGSGRTWAVGCSILNQFWKTRGKPVEVTGKLGWIQHLSQAHLRRALADLEHLGLIEVERHRGQPPIVRIPSAWNTGRKVYGVPLSVIKKEYGWRK